MSIVDLRAPIETPNHRIIAAANCGTEAGTSTGRVEGPTLRLFWHRPGLRGVSHLYKGRSVAPTRAAARGPPSQVLALFHRNRNFLRYHRRVVRNVILIGEQQLQRMFAGLEFESGLGLALAEMTHVV